MLALQAGIAVPLNVYEVADWTRHGFEAGARWVVFDELTRMTIALGHVAMVLLTCRPLPTRARMSSVAALGQMALTNYVMHTVFGVLVFSGVGLGWFGALARHQLYYLVAAIWAAQLIVSPLWLRAFRLGPLEWLWRSLTYARRQPSRVVG